MIFLIILQTARALKVFFDLSKQIFRGAKRRIFLFPPSLQRPSPSLGLLKHITRRILSLQNLVQSIEGTLRVFFNANQKGQIATKQSFEINSVAGKKIRTVQLALHENQGL